MDNENRLKLAEGKTKVILAGDTPGQVHVRSKDDLTAGDGERREVMTEKRILATTTTVNCFQLLAKNWARNHYIRRVSEDTFEAWQLAMIPLELVARRVATGSFLKRHPEVPEGKVFAEPVVEFFFKDDANHDPLAVYDLVSERWLLFAPKTPLVGSPIVKIQSEIRVGGFQLSERQVFEPVPKSVAPGRKLATRDVLELYNLTLKAFLILERKWLEIGVTLVDLKIEAGFEFNCKTGEIRQQIIIGDVVDNDSWRLWPGGDKSQQKDKQAFRDQKVIDSAFMQSLKDNYAWVADQTGRFLHH